MGGVEPTLDYLRRALARGASVVTANKQLLSRHGPELLRAAEEAGAELRFEASACAAIPVIKVLRESLLAAEIEAVTGIVNGTTNFILTEMSRGGASYAEALARAQELGYAEADPTEDVGGADAAAKMAILASIAFHSRVLIDDVPYEGIDVLQAEDIAHADALGFVVKLRRAWRGCSTGPVSVRVYPALVPRGHRLAAIERLRQRRAARVARDPRDHARGPRRRRRRDRLRRLADILSVLGTQQGSFLHNALVDAGRTDRAPRRGGVGLLPPHGGRRPPRRARPRRLDLRRRGALDPAPWCRAASGDEAQPGAGAARAARRTRMRRAVERIRGAGRACAASR